VTDSITVRSPRTGAVVGNVPITFPAGVADVVSRSRKAFEQWSRLTPEERRPYLKALLRTLAHNIDRVADVIVSETGKDRGDAIGGDIVIALANLDYYARHAHRLLRPRPGKWWPLPLTKAWTEFHPRGVAGVISPWNFPFQLSLNPVVTALAAGCSVVLKPSEVTPLSGQLVAELAAEADLPADLVMVINGYGDTGEALVRGGVDVVAFTGSTETGKLVAKAAADRLVPTILELGGKDAMLVLADADPDLAARAAVFGSTFNAGQACTSVERVYVVDSIYEPFLAAAERTMRSLTAGDGGRSDIGVITYPQQLGLIEEQVREAVAKGATVVVGGHRVGDNAYAPTLLTEVDHRMLVCRDETFGPVLSVMRVPDETTALELCNDSRYGLHGSVWTKDHRKGVRLASQMQTGTVAINDITINFFVPSVPFGGIKESGYGASFGPEGLYAYCYPKGITLARVAPVTKLLGAWLPRRPPPFGGPRHWKRIGRLVARR